MSGQNIFILTFKPQGGIDDFLISVMNGDNNLLNVNDLKRKGLSQHIPSNQKSAVPVWGYNSKPQRNYPLWLKVNKGDIVLFQNLSNDTIFGFATVHSKIHDAELAKIPWPKSHSDLLIFFENVRSCNISKCDLIDKCFHRDTIDRWDIMIPTTSEAVKQLYELIN